MGRRRRSRTPDRWPAGARWPHPAVPAVLARRDDAKLQWRAVLEGRNPYGGRLTPQIAATVERNYRRQLANAGQQYTRAEDAVEQAEKIVVRASAGGGSGGGSKGGGRTAMAAGDDDRAARQDALGPAVDRTRVGQLERPEIAFVERFQSLSDVPLERRLRWPPKGNRVAGQTLPSHDFEWLEREGLLMELKSIGNPTGAVIQNRIWKAMNESWTKHGFVRENFIIDIGDKELAADVKAILASYNHNNSGRRLPRLFIMSRGEITEVALLA